MIGQNAIRRALSHQSESSAGNLTFVYLKFKGEYFLSHGQPVRGQRRPLVRHLYALYVELAPMEVTYLMNIKWFSIPALALCMAAPATIKAVANEVPSTPTAAQSQDQYQDRDRDRDWDRTPDNYRDAQRQGFHEGMEAARSDYMSHRHADADDHDVYKHPPVDERDRGQFREGFKEGYRRAMDHMRNDRHRDHDDDGPRF